MKIIARKVDIKTSGGMSGKLHSHFYRRIP